MKRNLTEEEKKKISDSLKKGYADGRIAWAKGRSFSEEHKRNLSKARHRGFANGTIKSPFTGKVWTKEELEKRQLSILSNKRNLTWHSK